VFKAKRFFLFFVSIFTSFNVLSQISDLNLNGLTNCIPAKNSEVINSIELSYKEGVRLFNEVNSNLTESSNIEKLVNLYKIQLSTKNKLDEIWQQSDSLSKDESKKYFEEATKSFKGLTDSINSINPDFKSLNRALLIVEKSHQVILLQKFGIQVLFGCIRESTGKLSQPSDIPNIVINLDMIERFRKSWNESNYPMSYDHWVYTPTERKGFVKQSYADIVKSKSFVNYSSPSKSESTQKGELDTQNQLALSSTSTSNISGSEKSDGNNASTSNSDSKGNSTSRNISKTDQKYSIKGEGDPLNRKGNGQFEIKNLISRSKISSLGVDYFIIQIAASKNQLAPEKLNKEIICGKFKVEEKNENGWYKYIIGHFASIDSAVNTLSSNCISRGFVSGYNSKGRVAIFSIKQPRKSLLNVSSYSIVYRIQIAASKQPLAKEILSTLYKGNNPINVAQEDGWYRYSIGDCIYYDEAKVARDSCGVTNAFVMPYENGQRIQWPGKEALEQLKANQKENAIYVVQVAASRKPLPLDVISNIIKIDQPLTMKFEDGWYKYYISAFTDFATAKQVAEKVGIKGAFIATYKNGLRVNP
jgi:predicted transcriptional regulator